MATTLSKQEIADRIRGCIIGNAIGDAYGLATEFMTKDDVYDLYGNGPIQFGLDPTNVGCPVWLDFHRRVWEKDDFTDDTDQLIVLMQTLNQSQDGVLDPVLFAKRMIEWEDDGLLEIGTPAGRGLGYTVGSTLGHREFEDNPHKAAYDIWNANGRNLASNGALMRTAILGCESFFDEPRVVENALAAAKSTHADPRSFVTALLSSVLISRLLRGGGKSIEEDSVRVWNPLFSSPKTLEEIENYKSQLLLYTYRGSDIQGYTTRYPPYATANTPKTTFQPKGIPRAPHPSQHPLADFTPEDANENRPDVKWRDDIGWAGLDDVGSDPAMIALAKSVIQDYGFLITQTVLIPTGKELVEPKYLATAGTATTTENNDNNNNKVRIQDEWFAELQAHCFPTELEDLDLGSQSHMGYAYKCLGSGFYSVTRLIDPNPSQVPEYFGNQGLFRGAIEQVTLEAGDADTNCAVVGSLLGARFGLENGIPKNWSLGLKHVDWILGMVDQVVERTLKNLEKFEKQQMKQQVEQ